MQLVIANVILSYPHLWELHNYPDEPADKADYKCDFIFPQGFDYTQFEAGIAAAIAEKFPAQAADPNFVAQFRKPYKAQKPESPYAGCFHITGKGRKTQPQVVDQNLQPVMDRMLLPSGSMVNAQVNLFAYPPKGGGTYGVGVTLNMVQLVRTADGVTLPLLGGEVQRVEDHFQVIAGAPAPTAPMPGMAPAAAPIDPNVVYQPPVAPGPAAAPQPMAQPPMPAAPMQPAAPVPPAAPAPVAPAPAPAPAAAPLPPGFPQ